MRNQSNIYYNVPKECLLNIDKN